MADEKKKADKAEKDSEEDTEEAIPVGTTIPGGKYKVGGVFVDAEGKEIGKK